MGSYASHLLALEQAAQINPQTLPPPPPRPMDPHLEEYYEGGQVQEVYDYEDPDEMQAHMYPGDYGDPDMNGCTVDLTIRVAPSPRPFPPPNQRALGNCPEPSNRECWPDVDQQNGQRLIHPQMHMLMPPHMQGQLPPHMQDQMPPHMQDQMPPYMQGPMPPHMQGPMPPHMQGPMPPHMLGPMPPHMQGPMPPHMQGAMPPHMRGQMPPHMLGPMPAHMQGQMPPHMQSQMPPHMRGQMPPHIQSQMPFQPHPQMLFQLQQSPHNLEYWGEMEEQIDGEHEQMLGPNMEQQMPPMLNQCHLEDQAQAENREYWREIEQDNVAAEGQLYSQHPEYPMSEVPLEIQGHITPEHLQYWREMEEQENAQQMQNHGMLLNVDQEDNEIEGHVVSEPPPPEYWIDNDQIVATVAPHQQQEQQHHQRRRQLRPEDIQALSREIWCDVETNSNVNAPLSQTSPLSTSYDYWLDIEQLIASYGLHSPQPQEQGASAANVWQDVKEPHVAGQCYLEEADQQVPQLDQEPAPVWWPADGQHAGGEPLLPCPSDWLPEGVPGVLEPLVQVENVDEQGIEHQRQAPAVCEWWPSGHAMQQQEQQQHELIDRRLENEQNAMAEHQGTEHVHSVPTDREYWNDVNQGAASLESQAQAAMQPQITDPPNGWWVEPGQPKRAQDVPTYHDNCLEKEQQVYAESEQQQELQQDFQQEPQKQQQQPCLQQEYQKQQELEQEQQPQEFQKELQEEQECQEEKKLPPKKSTTPRDWWQAAAFTPQEHLQSQAQPVQPVQPRSIDSPVEWMPYSYGALTVSQTVSEEKEDMAPPSAGPKAACTGSIAPTIGNNDNNTNDNSQDDFPSFEDFARQVSECSLSSSEYIATLRNLMIRAHNLMLPLLRGRFANMTQVQMAAYTTAILEVTPLHPSLFLPSVSRSGHSLRAVNKFL